MKNNTITIAVPHDTDCDAIVFTSDYELREFILQTNESPSTSYTFYEGLKYLENVTGNIDEWYYQLKREEA